MIDQSSAHGVAPLSGWVPPMNDNPSVCVIGCASWDTLLPVDRYPPEGEYCVATGEIELPGGTSTNAAITLARLGLPPRFVGMVGDDWRGERLRAGLEAEGVVCDTLSVRHGQDSDRSIIPISPSGARTIFWIKGATIERGDALDTDLIFRHRALYLDLVDLGLWRDLLDSYERHVTRGCASPLRIGQAVYLAGVMPPDEAMALVGRHDVFIGGEWEWNLIAGTNTRDALLARIVALVQSTPLSSGVITLGAEGCVVVTRDRTFTVPAARVSVVDTTGAGDAFAGGYTYGLSQGWEPERCARFANAVGALATRAFGSQASLPTLDEAWHLAFLDDDAHP